MFVAEGGANFGSVLGLFVWLGVTLRLSKLLLIAANVSLILESFFAPNRGDSMDLDRGSDDKDCPGAIFVPLSLKRRVGVFCLAFPDVAGAILSPRYEIVGGILISR